MANTGNSQNTRGFPVVSAPGKVPVVTSIFDFSAEALAELRLWLEQNPPAIGISNILGFSQFTAKTIGTINASESTTSTAYTDLTTVGPTLTGLPDGQYLVLFKAVVNTAVVGNAALANVSVNGDTPNDNESVINFSTSAVGSMSWSVRTLSAGGNNSVKMVYRTNNAASAATFSFRQLAALKFANK